MKQNKALWEKGDFTRIAASMRKSGMKKTGSTTVRYESRTTIDRPVGGRVRATGGPGWLRHVDAPHGLVPPVSPNL